jgi:hypothetical protein
MTSAQNDTIQSFRLLLLPIRQESETVCADHLSDYLEKKHVAKEDATRWINLNLAQWKQDGSPPQELKELITDLLKLASDVDTVLVSKTYFDLHYCLLKDHLLKHEQARLLLCDILFISALAQDQRLSSSQLFTDKSPCN